jgi:hypothetical protein
MLYYDHMRVHALLHFKRDYKTVLELAVANTLEARKPQYDGMPQRMGIFEDLVGAYMGIDPGGYEQQIRESLAYVATLITPPLESRRHSLEANTRDFALSLNLLDEAEASCRRALALADRDGWNSTAQHYGVFVYSGMCEIAYRRKQWDLLAEHAADGEKLVRKVGHQMELGEFVMWQALLARRGGDEEKGQRFARRTASRIDRLHMPPTSAFYEAHSGFYEAGGELEKCLGVRERELKECVEQGRFWREFKLRVERCRLLKLLGQSTDAERAAAEAVAGKLKLRDKHLAELAAVL